MNHLQILGSSMLLLSTAVSLAAEPTATSDFAIEMTLAARQAAGQIIEVRCLQGCDWDTKTFTCADADGECRSLIASREDATASDGPATEPRPLSGSVCLGVGTVHDPDSRYETVETNSFVEGYLVSETTSVEGSGKAFVGRVIADSPADQAGFKRGDIIASFNGVMIQRRADFVDLALNLTPGQPFVAVLDRDGMPVTVRGRAGIRTSDHKCSALDERLRQRPGMTWQELEATSFKLAVDVPPGGAGFRCLWGCAWTDVSESDLGRLRGCWIEVDPISLGGSCPRNRPPRSPGVD